MSRHYSPQTRDEAFALEQAAWAVANASACVATLATPNAGQVGYDAARDRAIADLRAAASRIDKAAKALYALEARRQRPEAPERPWQWQVDDSRRRRRTRAQVGAAS